MNKYNFNTNLIRIDYINSSEEVVYSVLKGEDYSAWDLDGLLKTEHNFMNALEDKHGKLILKISIELSK